MVTSFVHAGPRHPKGRIIISLIVVSATAAFVAAGSWLLWTLTYDALGRQAASLAVVALLGGTFAISREIVRRYMMLRGAGASPRHIRRPQSQF